MSKINFFDDPIENSLIIGLTLLLTVSAFLFFSGLDSQVSFLVKSPGSYILGSDSNVSEENSVVFTEGQVDSINFVSKNRIGFDTFGDEVGFCSGIKDGNKVYDLRLAEGFEDLGSDQVSFSCVKPRDLVIHSQPRFGDKLSDEDKSFDGEFEPDVTCIVFNEVVVSPVSGEINGLSCWSVEEGDTGEKVFKELEIAIQ